MPRPKRTKVGARAAPRVDEPAQTGAKPAPAKATRKPRPGRDFVESYSEDSDGLVIKRGRPRKPIRVAGQPLAELSDSELVMTGGLPAPEVSTEDAEKSAPDAQASGSKQRRTSTHTPVKPRTRRSLGRATRAQEAEATLPAAGPAQDDESSLLDPSLLTFGSLDSDSPAHGTCPPSTIRVGGTPAHETSILALTNFRRRPRQPSLLRMVHQTTDVEGAGANSDDGDDLDDFHPDDESTPLRHRNNQPAAQQNDTSGFSVGSSGSRGTKRKRSSIIQVPRSSPPVEPSPTAARAEVPRLSSPSLPEGVTESQDAASQEPVVLSSTMAPPRSSSPVEEIEESSDEEAGPRKTGTNKNEATAGRGRTRKQSTKDQTLSTARLQALLPRRRTRATRERDEFDLDTSSVEQLASLDTDEDELQLPATRGRRGTSKTKPKATRGAKKANGPKVDGKESARTYSRRTSSDKENSSSAFLTTGDSAISSESVNAPLPIAAPSSTLAAIAKRFQDVDAFEMNFEEVDVGGMSSSPWR